MNTLGSVTEFRGGCLIFLRLECACSHSEGVSIYSWLSIFTGSLGGGQ